MIDEFAKSYLFENLQWAREDLVGKLSGLSEHDIRRPMTATGTNLLGLVHHLTLTEARYFGAVFDRPYPEKLPTFDDPGYSNEDHMWVVATRSRQDVLEDYRRAWVHADSTINELPIDAAGFVPWWPRPNVKLFNILVHVISETNRHLGHADVIRESLDGALGNDPTPASVATLGDWRRHRAAINAAAWQAQSVVNETPEG